jgi:threonine dehydratase
MLEKIKKARSTLQGVVSHTPLQLNQNISSALGASVYLKREDLQVVRSYKLRGAFNKISSLSEEELRNGVVCASAGNHAQGLAHSCKLLGIRGMIFMPVTTPKQKVNQVKSFGGAYIEVVLSDDTFDDTYKTALLNARKNNSAFIHPFDDTEVIAGQGTVALEILEDVRSAIDYLFVPIGGGGLAAGVCSVFKPLSPHTKIIGVQPLGAGSMYEAIRQGKVVTLHTVDKFVDGASVKTAGEKTFEICKDSLHAIVLVPEGKVCTQILRLYNEEGMVVEPAGALTIAALDLYKEQIRGKQVVCIVSGGNNDITRTEEIKERSLLYENLKHYFVINFAQRSGALKEFVTEVLGEHDDITYFQYSKKNSRDLGPAVIGIEVKEREDLEFLLESMRVRQITFEYLNHKPELLQFIT